MSDRQPFISDAELVAGIREGNARLLDVLFGTYYVPLCEFAHHIVQSMDVAEEVAAEVIASVWRGRATWAPASSVAAYLYGAVRNRARNVLRGERRAERWRALFTDAGDVPALGTAPTSADDALDAADRAATVHTALRDALAMLPERARLIVLLRWEQQLDYDEIAHIVGSTSAAVQMQMSRAFKILRERLPDDVR